MIGSVSTITLFGLLVQVAGFLRMAIIAAALGLTGEVDAYYLGLTLPSLAIAVIGNWIQLTYLGRYTTLLTENRAHLANKFKNSMCLSVLMIGIVLATVGFTFPQVPMDIFLGDEHSAAATTAFKFVCLVILPVTLADFMGQTLNGHQRFSIAALAPLANALVATISLWFWPEKGLTALIGSLILGSITQLLIVSPYFFRLNISCTRQTQMISIRGELKSVATMTLMVVPAVLLANAMFSVIQFSASRFGEGAVALMSYANRINSGITQLLIIGLGTVLIPHFAVLVVNKENSAIAALLGKLTRGAVIVCFLICAGLFLYGQSFVSLLFERGNFGEQDAQRVATLLFILSLSLLPLSLGTFVARYFSAIRRVDLLLYSGIISFAATLLGAQLALSLGHIYLVGLVPLVAYTSTMIFWLCALSRSIAITHILQDFIVAAIRMVIILLPPISLDFVLEPVLAEMGVHIALVIRCSVFITATCGLAIVTGSVKWIFSSPQSKDADLQPKG